MFKHFFVRHRHFHDDAVSKGNTVHRAAVVAELRKEAEQIATGLLSLCIVVLDNCVRSCDDCNDRVKKLRLKVAVAMQSEERSARAFATTDPADN